MISVNIQTEILPLNPSTVRKLDFKVKLNSFIHYHSLLFPHPFYRHESVIRFQNDLLSFVQPSVFRGQQPRKCNCCMPANIDFLQRCKKTNLIVSMRMRGGC
jgi:hypothetical protein